MPKDTKTLGNSKARACESLGFVHKKGCARVLTQPLLYNINIMLILLDIFYSSSYLIIRKLPLTCNIDIIYTIPL